MRWLILACLLSLASCAAERTTREPLTPLQLPGAEELDGFVASLDRLSCSELHERMARVADELRGLGAYEATGEAQAALAERVLGCPEPWAALALSRYLPHLLEKRMGADAVRDVLGPLAKPPHRQATLGQLRRWLEEARNDAGRDVESDAWWSTERDEVGPFEALVAPSCDELTGIVPRSTRAYDAAMALWRHAECNVQPVVEAGLRLSSPTRGDACLAIGLEKLPVAGNALARAIVTDPGERLTKAGGMIDTGPIVIPRPAVTVGTTYWATARCTKLALARGGLVLHPARSTELAFTHFGALRALLVARLDDEGRVASALRVGDPPAGTPMEWRAWFEKAAPTVLERWETGADDHGRTGWRSIEPSSLGGPPSAAAWRVRFDPSKEVGGEHWTGHAKLRVVAVHEDGSVALGTLGPDSVTVPARPPRTKATHYHGDR